MFGKVLNHVAFHESILFCLWVNMVPGVKAKVPKGWVGAGIKKDVWIFQIAEKLPFT